MGTDGFEFVEYTAPDPQLLRSLFERLGFPVVARHRSKNVTLHSQGDINFIINAEPDSFAQKFAQAHGPSVCAMAFRVRDAAAAFERAVALGAEPHRNSVGPDGAQHPGDRRHRRVTDLFRRSLRRSLDLRRGLQARGSAAAGARRAAAHRPSHAQRASRQHGQVDRRSTNAVQFPRDPLLRHRRQEDRAVLARADQSLRQDPHPDQRVAGRQVADRGIPARVPRRGHPAHRARDRGHLSHGGRVARPRRRVPGHPRHLLRRRGRPRRRPSARIVDGAARSAAFSSTAMARRRKACCCRSSPPT